MSYRDFETVSSVITRLGQPPSDISALWMEDVRSQCDAQDIPPLDANTTFWQHVVVDDRGRPDCNAMTCRWRRLPQRPK